MNIFSKYRLGDSYAVTVGDNIGKMYMYIDKSKTDYQFLTVPELLNVSVPCEIFDRAVSSGIVEFIERVPKYVRKISEIQFRENKKKLQSTT